MAESPDLTSLLQQLDKGTAVSSDALLQLVYGELRQMAASQLRRERPGQTLQATDLVHEAWLRLSAGGKGSQWSGRRHFFAAAAEAMRRILVEKARRKNREKHGRDWQRVRVNIDELAETRVIESDAVEMLDRLLPRLIAVDPVACELVKLRFFAGFTLQDAASLLEMPRRSADRRWAFARAWLIREMTAGDEP